MFNCGGGSHVEANQMKGLEYGNNYIVESSSRTNSSQIYAY